MVWTGFAHFTRFSHTSHVAHFADFSHFDRFTQFALFAKFSRFAQFQFNPIIFEAMWVLPILATYIVKGDWARNIANEQIFGISLIQLQCWKVIKRALTFEFYRTELEPNLSAYKSYFSTFNISTFQKLQQNYEMLFTMICQICQIFDCDMLAACCFIIKKLKIGIFEIRDNRRKLKNYLGNFFLWIIKGFFVNHR